MKPTSGAGPHREGVTGETEHGGAAERLPERSIALADLKLAVAEVPYEDVRRPITQRRERAAEEGRGG